MGLVKYKNIGIKALTATVPRKIVKTIDLVGFFTEEEINKFIEATGVKERRFAENDVCASDLCYKSACNLLEKAGVDRNDIDMIIFVSQTPDYKSPGTSIILQNKLGLKTSTIAYDVNMSCSGFIHGLMMSYSFLQQTEINNVLLLVGDTLTKVTSPKDKGTGLLLGDAGIAAIISKGEQFGESYFSMNTDGAYIDLVKIPAGGARISSSEETFEMQEFEDGSIRSLEQVIMVGTDVFSFAISELPKDINKLLTYANCSVDDIDKYAFHQANNFMTNYVAKKVKANPDKILRSIHKYGNTAGTSIPLCMVENKDEIKEGESILMNAIGAGFAYGTVLLNIADCKIIELSEL